MTREEAIKILMGYSHTPQERAALEVLIPELAESEDERIRKFLIEILSHGSWRKEWPFSPNEVVAWLEKQKEPHYTKRNALFDKCVENCDPEVMKSVSDEVDEMLEKERKPNIELIQRSWYMEGYHDGEFGKEPKWIIKTGEGGPKHELNPRYGQPLAKEQKPEWSEEDERILKGIIGKIDHDQTYGVSKAEMLSFLKSLRNRGTNCTPSWKPSEEQMEALLIASNVSKTDAITLRTLYEQLKEL